MPIKLIGKATTYVGKPLWEILGNLKDHGVGRIVIRSLFQRYSEPTYMKILKVAALPPAQQAYSDRKVMVLVERTFRGQKSPRPIQLDSATYKPDYLLIPKDQEHLYLEANVTLPEKRLLPKTMDFPPLILHLIKQRLKAKGVVSPEEPKLTIRYNETNMMHKKYRVVKEDETTMVELKFGVDKSSVLYPKTEEAAAAATS